MFCCRHHPVSEILNGDICVLFPQNQQCDVFRLRTPFPNEEIGPACFDDDEDFTPQMRKLN